MPRTEVEIVHDTLIYFRRAFSLSSYKLNSLADHFLGGRQKLDVKPREMFRLFQVYRNDNRLREDETTESAKLKMEDVARYCRRILQPAAQQLERVQFEGYELYVSRCNLLQPAAQQVERVQLVFYVVSS